MDQASVVLHPKEMFRKSQHLGHVRQNIKLMASVYMLNSIFRLICYRLLITTVLV